MSTALYRRYRPETFADVIGQEHVTDPLMTALENNRVNHAYLFSGPRGCGKTTSARILARCLNCAQGPTPTPCGECDSCVELARDGSGSLDVIEMDAASHGGVDHARDLRERATFAPVRDRYKIFIIDEAHMVTREGFNALLKIVEEPPEHIKFIFATTEPNKVLGTIRSRTHHYPFRLVPPEVLHDYLAKLCDEEQVKVEDGVLQLVVRAGGGSVRDSLSTLDQLMAGSGAEGITYDLAVALLGFTHAELLDEVVISFATGNAADVFTAVDRVIQSGQDPRRFVEDLLERFRDLIIVQAVPEAAASILHGMSADQIGRLRSQAAAFGSAELSRAADVTNSGLNEMSGATSPQLHLELLCARILLPASDKTVGGVGARLDRLERRVSNGEIGVPQQGANQQNIPPQNAPVSANASAQQTQQNQPPQSTEQPRTAPLANLKKQREEASASTQGQSNSQRQSTAGQTQPPSQAQRGGERSSQSGSNGQNTVLMAQNAWQEIVGHVQSPPARQWFAQCQPSKFENGALYIRADIQTLRQVKNYIPQLKTALREVIQLDADVHAEVAKASAPKPQQNPAAPPLRNEQSREGGQHNTQPNTQANTQPQNNQPEIARGPRGGEEAWRAHGRPLTNEAPAWSTEDWNNPVTDWDVASIPSEDSAETNQVENSAQKSSGQDSASGPQLRVIAGEANEKSDRSRVNHPSSGVWQRPDISAAPTPDDVEEGYSAPVSSNESDDSDDSDEPNKKNAISDPVTEGEEKAEESAESSPVAAQPTESSAEDNSRYTDKPDNRPAQTGIADGTAEAAPADESMIPDPPKESVQDSADSKSSESGEDESSSPKVSADSRPQPPVADEYGDYEGGQFDDAPDEPEYVAGMGYVPEGTASFAEVSEAAPVPGVLPPLAQSVPGYRPAENAPAKSDKTPPGDIEEPAPKSSGFRERYAAQLAAGQRASEKIAPQPDAPGNQPADDFSISDEDETLESSVLIGQRAVEKVLGGIVIEERPHGH